MGKLTEAELYGNLRPGRYSYGDGLGLEFYVDAHGNKRWFQDLRWHRERRHLRLGDFPAVSPASSVKPSRGEPLEAPADNPRREEARKFLDNVKQQTLATSSAGQATAKGAFAALGALVDNTETKMKELSEKLDRVEKKVDRLLEAWSE